MADCTHGYNGTATVTVTVTRHGDTLTWDRADPRIVVADVLANDPFVLERYEILDVCTDGTHHAVIHGA